MQGYNTQTASSKAYAEIVWNIAHQPGLDKWIIITQPDFAHCLLFLH